jgi:hypothetical protein
MNLLGLHAEAEDDTEGARTLYVRAAEAGNADADADAEDNLARLEHTEDYLARLENTSAAGAAGEGPLGDLRATRRYRDGMAIPRTAPAIFSATSPRSTPRPSSGPRHISQKRSSSAPLSRSSRRWSG